MEILGVFIAVVFGYIWVCMIFELIGKGVQNVAKVTSAVGKTVGFKSWEKELKKRASFANRSLEQETGLTYQQFEQVKQMMKYEIQQNGSQDLDQLFEKCKAKAGFALNNRY
ncbi:MAG: hypothetical protein J6M05_05375 [Cardiobacteriaceae bacterium]|nr:hypothetical protein [Cardiobacteriaceae bacterium]